MIDLFSVKLNNNYDEIGATPTIENGTFLCDMTSENYTRGYSYQITNGNAERIETAQDYKIKNAIYPTIQNVCEWLNNFFVKHPNPEFCRCGLSDIDKISNGDLCLIITPKGKYVSYVNINGKNLVVFDNSSLLVEKDLNLIVDVTGSIVCDNGAINADEFKIRLMRVPQDFELAISQMIFYDVFTRGTVDGLKSESVGNYSYTKDDVTVGTLAYPKALISGIEACYRKLRFVQ